MSAEHEHGAGRAARSAGAKHQSRLLLVLNLTATYVLAEVAGGLYTHSLALLADAGHLATDALGLAMALAAICPAPRHTDQNVWVLPGRDPAGADQWRGPARGGRPYPGRVLAAPPPTGRVDGLPMLLVACGGLLVTLTGVAPLHAGAEESLNVKGAFLEVLSDLLGAVGTIAATHDLHVWTITSGFVAMSGHLQTRGRPSADVLHDAQRLLKEHFKIEHTTLQVEQEIMLRTGPAARWTRGA